MLTGPRLLHNDRDLAKLEHRLQEQVKIDNIHRNSLPLP